MRNISNSVVYYCWIMSSITSRSKGLSSSNSFDGMANKLIPFANSYSASFGLLLEKKYKTYEPAPISLLPNVFPKKEFDRAVELAPKMNKLMDAISYNEEFLLEELDGVDEEFTGKLVEMFREIYLSENHKEAKFADRLGILRSDYMLTNPGYQLKQIECNTIASSFAGLATRVSKFHDLMCSRFLKDLEQWFEYNRNLFNPELEGGGKIPENTALVKLAYSMNIAHMRYISRHNVLSSSSVILFVVQEGETNTIDQRLIEYTLLAEHSIKVIRLSLKEINLNVKIDDNKALFFEDEEISLVYFRAGYTPNDYPTKDEWDGRRKLETSRATKCPNLGYHLAGCKKIQQTIADENVLKKFVSTQDCGEIQQVFAGLYNLNNDNITEEDVNAVLDAVESVDGGEKYVLKPQREGGGYNYYGEEMREILKSNIIVEGENKKVTLKPRLKEFILMERLHPPEQKSILMRGGNMEAVDLSISELGCFGTVLSSINENNEVEIHHNEYAGFLLRTKFNNVNEGGVASGFATLSSPYLCT